MDEQARGQRRMGRGMMMAFWVLVLGLGAWWFQGVLEERRNPNAGVAQTGGDGRVVLERNRSGHFVATGRINGEPVTFLLDTGATYVTVSPGTASRLGLREGPVATFSTANGRVRGHLTRLDTVRPRWPRRAGRARSR
ncbi:retropepsin-like aspartic protease family protein [Arhodomonas aquaeolei]|uniref:retropepsin-like aspartic protease family protein n=1 Tax=Arhodomonas aquaeolei TaxID=2369 RepID=UPI0003A936EA|nr:retropepsin-like aspartic protease [Arhodomonas aquaeolei]